MLDGDPHFRLLAELTNARTIAIEALERIANDLCWATVATDPFESAELAENALQIARAALAELTGPEAR